MSSVLDLDLNGIPEEELAPEGEYQLLAISNEITNNEETGSICVKVVVSLTESETAPDIHHYILISKPADGAKDTVSRVTRLRKFYAGFGIDLASYSNIQEAVDSGDICDKTARGMIKSESSDDFGDQNRIAKVLPPMQ